MDVDGLYLYKRPIESHGGSDLLAIGGSVFHHVIVYLKHGNQARPLYRIAYWEWLSRVFVWGLGDDVRSDVGTYGLPFP
jgi:hypothetical protein